MKWIGALSVGILAHSGGVEEEISTVQKEEDKHLQLPVQGPACNSSDHFVGWHPFDSSQ